MPLIEFRCSENHITEKIMSFAEAEGAERIHCPHCFLMIGKSTKNWALRVLFAPAVIFKGDGFTPRFHKPSVSQIGGVPVKPGDDPVQVAKKVVANHGGGERLFNGLTGKRSKK